MRFFWGFLLLLIGQRLAELWLARRHTARIILMGGYEVGREHYSWIILTHVLFFAGLIAEVTLSRRGLSPWLPLWLGLFALAQVVRYWAITSLGLFWNTRVYVVPGMPLVRRGPYRYFRHPNYAAIVVELLVVPLMFNAYVTAVVISLLNALGLSIRIRYEERALQSATKENACTESSSARGAAGD